MDSHAGSNTSPLVELDPLPAVVEASLPPSPEISNEISALPDIQASQPFAHRRHRRRRRTWPIALRAAYYRMTNTKPWRLGNFAIILFFIPVTIALLTVYIVDWEQSCDRPLKLWTFVQICLQTFLILVNMTIVNKMPPSVAPPEYQERRMASLHAYFLSNRVIIVLWCLWCIVGMAWSFDRRGDCSETAPFLHRICNALLIIQLIIITSLSLWAGGYMLLVSVQPSFLADSGSRGAPSHLIQSLSWKKFKEGLVPKEDANCAICLSEYRVGERIRHLPCQHHFHLACVDQWLATNKSCPFCKRDVDADSGSDSESDV